VAGAPLGTQARRRLMPPRGTRDILPSEARLRDRVVDTARAVFEAYGYGRIQTPTFEETEVFARGVGASTDIVRKEMYTFTDGGGRSLTLRPEGTAPVVRAFVEHGMHKMQLPVKLWYVAPMFRYEAPQAGRYREHTQLGIEAIGSDDPLLDAEVICVLADLYDRLGVPGVALKVSSMGDPDTRAAYRPALLAYLERHVDRLSAEERDRLRDNPLRLFDAKDERVRVIMEGAPKIVEHLSPAARAHHDRLLAALRELGIAYEEDPMLVRGFDYYTKTVFEFSCDRLGAQSGIGGGGRYNGLVQELGGPDTPGIGFGSGLERITLALEAAGAGEEDGALDCYIAIPDDELRIALMPLLRRLRAAGVRCDSDLRGRSLKAMLRQAAGLRARRTVIIGPREHAAGVATVRDMATGDQREVPLDQLVEALS
jgi:histidyl-tRNA synthetase